MGRILKFRGKRVDNGEWRICSSIEVSTSGVTLIGYEEVIPDTVGQFTGLKDKTGHDIYEDDIITSDDIHTRAIKWNSYECKFNAVEWGIDKAIILGNIHDNPELLKSEEHE